MTDKLVMESYLLILKSTIEVYVHGTLESANDKIKYCLQDGLNQTLKSQENTFKEMVKRSWYQVKNIG